MSKQRTTASLRELLFESIEAVKGGSMVVEQAKSVALLAEKIIGTARLELEYAMTVSHLDSQEQGISPGPILLTNPVVNSLTEPTSEADTT